MPPKSPFRCNEVRACRSGNSVSAGRYLARCLVLAVLPTCRGGMRVDRQQWMGTVDVAGESVLFKSLSSPALSAGSGALRCNPLRGQERLAAIAICIRLPLSLLRVRLRMRTPLGHPRHASRDAAAAQQFHEWRSKNCVELFGSANVCVHTPDSCFPRATLSSASGAHF